METSYDAHNVIMINGVRFTLEYQCVFPYSFPSSPLRPPLYLSSDRLSSIALEEMEIPYDAHTINIMKDEQFTPEFIAINPNSKIPAIVDPMGAPDGTPLKIFESGAILLYLAEKSGKFLPQDAVQRWETLSWLFFQMGGVGPMFGQFGHFFKYARDKCDHPYPTERYTNEARRLLGVLEKRLEGREFLIDAGYTIADMATFPWVICLKVGAGVRFGTAGCCCFAAGEAAGGEGVPCRGGVHHH
ncbi:unnamed protein product [Closterium sp. Naga37s-1]|nr:unnamed protein product [Closterium sp. Naga37s-1]